jgi:hypothetical protein
MATVYLSSQNLKVTTSLDTSNDVSILRSQVWWNKYFACRRNTLITAPDDGLQQLHPISAFIPKQVYYNKKIQDSFNDLDVLYLQSEVPDTWIRLPRVVDSVSDYYRVRFLLQEELGRNESTDKYYLYYANPFQTNSYAFGSPFASSEDERILDWPITLSYSDNKISYTRPNEHWVDGASSTQDAKAYFQFYGPQLKVNLDKGPNCGIAEIQIDSGNWTQFDLYADAVISGNKANNYNYTKNTNNPISNSGIIKFDSTDFKSVSFIRISNIDKDGNSLLNYFNELNTMNCEIKVQSNTSESQYVVFRVLGVSSKLDYFELECSHMYSSVSRFTEGLSCKITFSPYTLIASQLGNGMHEVRIKVTGQKNPKSSSTKVQLRSISYKKHSIAKDIREEHYEGYGWSGNLVGE